MGEAKQRMNRLAKMQADQPYCIYCGGDVCGSSIDHMPPITVFANRQRLKGMEYMACQPCHDGTRALDQVAGMLCRLYPNDDTPATRAELEKIMRGIGNNFPDILREMAPKRERPSIMRQARQAFPGAVAAMTVGPILHRTVSKFGARVALALHYELCREIVPRDGAALVRWHTNASLLDGSFPDDFVSLLGSPKSLRQGRKSLEGQFDFSSIATEDRSISAHLATFRSSFAIQCFVARDVAVFDRFSEYPQLLFRPAFLAG